MRRSFYPKFFHHLERDLPIVRALDAGRSFAPRRRAPHEEATMQLLADRFAVDDRGRAIDLASGARVAIATTSGGGVSEQLRWNARCGWLHTLQHRAIASLVDYGLVGDCSRFEAFDCGSIRRGATDEMRAVHDRAARFLHGTGLSAAPFAHDRVRTRSDGRAVWLPDANSGYEREDATPTPTLALRDCGLRIVERPAVAALAEMFQLDGARPRIAALWGPAGSGKRLVVRALARAARASGLVPIAAPMIDSPLAELWRGRSLFIVAADGDAATWRLFVGATVRTARPHVLLIVSDLEHRFVDGVGLRRLGVDALVASILPAVAGTPHEDSARRIAERAQGLPGRFARLLHPGPIGAVRHDSAWVHEAPIAAEQPMTYGVDEEAGRLVPERTRPASAWPAPGELASLRRRADSAIARIGLGRHAPGTRDLRYAVGGFARRGAWLDAARNAHALATALLRRGRVRDAQAAIDQAHDYATRAGSDEVLVDVAVLSGHAWIDLARLDEAEAALATAAAAARVARDATRTAAASLALARALFWRGRYADADAALRQIGDPQPRAIQVRRSLLGSRVAVGARDFSRAMSIAAAARHAADESGDASLVAAAAHAAAFVHLAVADWAAVDKDIAASIVAARAAHDPLRAMRARLLRAEAERRQGRLSAARADLEHLRRIVSTAPPVLRVRWQAATAVAGAPGDAETIVARHVAASTLGALPLYVAGTTGAAAPRSGEHGFVDQLISILHVCQTAEEESALLRQLCGRVRPHVHAASVAVVATRHGRPYALAYDGAQLDPDVAVRAAAAGVVLTPHRRDDCVEAAAPVVYGGVALGALCARWTLGSTYDTSAATSILAATAAAAAPIVAGAIAKAEQPHANGLSELIGATPAMAELRRSVERAAAAPFAVLIDGESGSGKELVARAIHRGSGRRHKAFCTLNCAALPDDLVESELFGHARGSFTGAVADRAGVFEEADGGTLFLDEVGELSGRAQAKLLRVLQEGELRRVGDTTSRRIDVRVVAATNRRLPQEVDAGRFRLDLLYRLDVVHITVPPLRDRREDIPMLAEQFWRDAAARVGSRATLAATTLAALALYDWPGNVRELQNVLAALAVRTPKRGVVPPSALPPAFVTHAPADACRLEDARRTFEERFVRAALVRTGGHRGRAAAELGVTRQGLTKLMTRLGISP
jgi:DNA-binding NtrC family response regulator/tetratricopeptide (TPR) repeat protein